MKTIDELPGQVTYPDPTLATVVCRGPRQRPPHRSRKVLRTVVSVAVLACLGLPALALLII